MSVAELKTRPARGSNELVTEDSAAQRFAELYRDRLRFCHDTGAWFEWDGAIWRQNRTCVALQWARELARDLAAEEPDKVRYVSSETSFAGGVERFARGDPAIAVTADRWDRDPYLIGTPGGTVDLRTGKLAPADPRDGITKATAVTPSTNADCPLWLRFLDETTGSDAGLIRFLQQFLGYALTGDVKEHALLFGYGSGGNGKSVLLNTVAGIAGAYATTAAMDTFAASSGDRHTTDLAMLRGARLVTASETKEGRAWAEARIKQITGGDPITARFMRCDNFTFNPAFKLFIVGNHKPVLRNVDDAARRRFCIVPFTRKPPRPDRDLEANLKGEWPSILRWLIDGCLDWQRHGLVRPQAVIDATSEYFGAQDIVGQFLEDECDAVPSNPHLTTTAAGCSLPGSATQRPLARRQDHRRRSPMRCKGEASSATGSTRWAGSTEVYAFASGTRETAVRSMSSAARCLSIPASERVGAAARPETESDADPVILGRPPFDNASFFFCASIMVPTRRSARPSLPCRMTHHVAFFCCPPYTRAYARAGDPKNASQPVMRHGPIEPQGQPRSLRASEAALGRLASPALQFHSPEPLILSQRLTRLNTDIFPPSRRVMLHVCRSWVTPELRVAKRYAS